MCLSVGEEESKQDNAVNHSRDAELAAKLQAELDAESDSSDSEEEQPEPNNK